MHWHSWPSAREVSPNACPPLPFCRLAPCARVALPALLDSLGVATAEIEGAVLRPADATDWARFMAGPSAATRVFQRVPRRRWRAAWMCGFACTSSEKH